MIRFDRSRQSLAVGVAMLAGFVDAVGFVESGGYFVSFMTGNSTRLAVGAAEWRDAAMIAGGIIATFVAGVVAGSLAAAKVGHHRTPAVLACVTLLLALAAILRLSEAGWAAVACLAFAMGVVNAALQGQDGAVVGVTYMTGTLVQMGDKIANRLRGEGDSRWLHHFGLWAGLIVGAIVGAHLVLRSPLLAYASAIGIAGLLTIRAVAVNRRGG